MVSAILGDDTDAKTEEVLLELLRQATPAHRVQQALSLTDLTRQMCRLAIARAHPEWNERTVWLEFVKLTYGSDLAERLTQFLARREA